MENTKGGCVKHPLLFYGFTLIELLVVVAIIGIISAIATTSLLTALQKAKQKATMADMRTIGMMMESYHINEQRYPIQGSDFTTMQELKTLLKDYVPLNAEPDMSDKWGTDFHYVNLDPDGEHYRLESFGKDKKDGPQDITRDTSNQFHFDIVIENGTFVNAP